MPKLPSNAANPKEAKNAYANVPPAETAALLKAFMKIQDAAAREMIVKLVERLSAARSADS